MIPVNKFKLDRNDKIKLIKVLNNNWISSAGPEVKEFENKFKKLIEKNIAQLSLVDQQHLI